MHHNSFYYLFISSAFSIDIYSNAPTIRPGCALEKRLGASLPLGDCKNILFSYKLNVLGILIIFLNIRLQYLIV